MRVHAIGSQQHDHLARAVYHDDYHLMTVFGAFFESTLSDRLAIWSETLRSMITCASPRAENNAADRVIDSQRNSSIRSHGASSSP